MLEPACASEAACTGRHDLSKQRDERRCPFSVPERQSSSSSLPRCWTLHPIDQHQGESIAALNTHTVYQTQQHRIALRWSDIFQLHGIERSGFGRKCFTLSGGRSTRGR